MASLAGKRVLITGGAGGIGLCTARAFLSEGSEVILTDIRQEALDEARRDLEHGKKASGGKVVTHVNDVTQYAEAQALSKEVGSVDVLINNAGIGFSSEIRDTSLEDWQRLININIWGTVHFIKAFLPAMIERKAGQVVNVSSGQAFFPVPTWGAYAATKFFVAGLSEALHYEVARFGVKVTTVFPYVVKTGFYTEIATPTLGSQMLVKLMPLYATTPEKMGKLIMKAVKKGKKSEMHHPFNKGIYYFSRLLPVVMEGTGRTIAWSLTRGKK